MKKLEKLIESIPFLPPILYFGSVGLLGYDIYSYVFYEIDFLNAYTRYPLTIIFFFMTGLGVKKYQNKK
ncbi:MAG: hypothetical protein F3745_01640 [Nitrospinae bacterium]|nr:hypothetical protein [Nitrospinota bacterium]